jgi:hypothetical protein
MQRNEFEEMGRLAELYRDHKTTNPCLVLALDRELSAEDQRLLRFIIDHSDVSRVFAWRSEAARAKNPADGRDAGRGLAKEEYASMAKRDAEHAKNNAVLSFVIEQKLR